MQSLCKRWYAFVALATVVFSNTHSYGLVSYKLLVLSMQVGEEHDNWSDDEE